MNRSETEDGRHEIVIVRRGGHDDDDEHHGGVWKIAFADFMTAMMCFFLVMWLINAANEQTRVALASYFNPIKLIDRNTNRKGIDDIGQGPQSSATSERSSANTDRPSGARRVLTGPADKDNASNNSEVLRHSDENLFADPYAVLAEIAADTGTLQNVSPEGAGGEQIAGPATGASGGQSYRDPFAPDFWSTQVEAPTADETAKNSEPEGRVKEEQPETAERFAGEVQDAFSRGPAAGRQPDEELAEAFSQPAAEEASAAQEATAEQPPVEIAKLEAAVDRAVPGKAPQPEQAVESVPEEIAKAQRLAQEIRAELSDAFGGEANLKGITVEQSDAGVMISVADDMEEGMFEIGSAVPRRELVLAMEKIGRTLAEHRGKVTINGHTDARPFTSGDYDNWRLSTARAQSTYYMLVRGGLEEARVVSVAGFADRKLKRPDDPYASVNRRIEILLDTSG